MRFSVTERITQTVLGIEGRNPRGTAVIIHQRRHQKHLRTEVMVVTQLTVKLTIVTSCIYIVNIRGVGKHFTRALVRLRKIGDQLVFLAQLINHVKIAELLVVVVRFEWNKTIGSVSQNIGVFRPVAQFGKRCCADVLRQFGANGSVSALFQWH